MHETSIYLGAWEEQQQHERSLRKMVGIWVFTLMSLQIVAVFGLVVWDGGQHKADSTLIRILIPSVLAEVFGMGFVVVKYLFRPSDVSASARRKKK